MAGVRFDKAKNVAAAAAAANSYINNKNGGRNRVVYSKIDPGVKNNYENAV